MYKQLNDEAYTALRKALLDKNRADLRKEFLQAALSGKQFVAHVREEHGVGTEGEDELPLLDEPFTEEQYKQPTTDTEIFQPWTMIPPKVACRPTFWAEITLRHIESGNIQASYLAASANPEPSGEQQLENAVMNGVEKDVSECVLTILRRMGGIPEMRGNVSTYVNCPFACAWWQARWATEVHKVTDVPVSRTLKLFRLSSEYWETLVRFVVSRNSVLGDRNVRDVLIWLLTERQKANSKDAMLIAKNLRGFCRVLGIRCAWQELGTLEISELKNIIDEEIQHMRVTS